ncbi:cation-translocating P-type ATPase [Pararhizobium sp. A13]|uniref:cation-translocating P-type ATPase n=1 Tax=Pararhizobium sp. A13 TaxID=3133975 RepID=UPI00311AD059
MSCCAPGAENGAEACGSPSSTETLLASRPLDNGLYQTDLSVPGVRCANCIRTIEGQLSRLPGVEQARVNLSSRRVSVKWRGDQVPPMIETLSELGYAAHLSETKADEADPELSRLIRALSVAGFSAMNIMLLSVSVWSGADAETRQAFHWISAALAAVALFYSGPVFFHSAWAVLRRGRTNMDVPISIGICLAFGLSLHDTIHWDEHAYFDAAASLIFFLLIGRTLDRAMRERARVAVRGLMRLSPRVALVVGSDGSRNYIPVNEVEPGMRINLAAGDRVPVDGCVEEGSSDIDCAIATGESAPQPVGPGAAVTAGTLNLAGPLRIVATATADNSFLAEMVRMMEAAEGGRAGYRRLADRAAQLYSPVVHTAAFVTFLGWIAATGDWHRAISIAIAVLIITCPCALGLAVPIVQVVAARRLFENGIMLKDGSGIERLAEIDTVVFDKTGTLTLGRPRLVKTSSTAPEALHIAAAMARHSRHPVAAALSAASKDGPEISASDIAETPGFGIEARIGGRTYRLGRAEWALADRTAEQFAGTVLTCNGLLSARFVFEDELRKGAMQAVGELHAVGLQLEILSGDREPAVASVARHLGIGHYAAGLLPGGKVERLERLSGDARSVLMVGDGLNDVPALAAAHVSMAPANAADIGRNAADFVFLHEDLGAVPMAVTVARKASMLVWQNFALAVLYNVIALPVAIAGHVTPLIAALAMSLSSVVVVTNALRLKAGKTGQRQAAAGSRSMQILVPGE